jgi:hypothetical protein
VSKITFYEFHPDDRPAPERHRWAMSAGLGHDGTVYATGVAHPAGELGAFLCAGHDGVPVAEYRDHLYYPINWLRFEIRAALASARPAVADELRQTLATLDRIEKETRRPDRPGEGV